MLKIRTFTVVPQLPQRLEPLRRLAYNLWWSWDHQAISLFQRLERDLWELTNHNPIRMLGTVTQDRLAAIAEDEGFLAHMDNVIGKLDAYMAGKSWFHKEHSDLINSPIAYFSAEYGLVESLPNYSGGLGVLSGDHMKSASDLGLPMVGVGLLYRQGYFRQYLNADGWQQETYPENDFYNLPLERVLGADGAPVIVKVDYPEATVTAQVWRVQVGRIPLYLLDANIPENRLQDREITAQLYGGDLEMRIKQEILLGIGGMRALVALGIEPSVCHMNEGHSAFLGLERSRMAMQQYNLNFNEALELTASSNVFTTHTPVPAGNDRFPSSLMRRYFAEYSEQLGLRWDAFLALGRENPKDQNESFCMTVLAIRMADFSNGVSRLHGEVSRKMWQRVWPDVPADEIPIHHITNGIHTRTWISQDMADLFNRYLGPRWIADPHDQTIWRRLTDVPEEELWRTHERRRERLVAFARRRLKAQLKRRGYTPKAVSEGDWVLNPEALTIGFARRFATYKRATLLFRDMDRLTKILCNTDRPVQIIFAGKAHPRDDHGKDLIRNIVHTIRENGLRHHIVFIEDYDLNVARYMVQGVDVWLNTPRRPLEASGTSGMKATANGAINMSVLDGWWDEAYNGQCGWAIGEGEEYSDHAYQDEVESNAIYDILEHEVVPLFYDRSADGLPRSWVAKMKHAMADVCPVFNTNRMLVDYTEKFYVKAAQKRNLLIADSVTKAKELTHWKERVTANWDSIHIEDVNAITGGSLQVGSQLEIQARVNLGQLSPSDIAVQLYEGPLSPKGEITNGNPIPMKVVNEQDGLYNFQGVIPCNKSGLHGFTVRVLPAHEDMSHPFELFLIAWH